jgi:hypothetical protein
MSYRVSGLLTDPEPTIRSVSSYIETQMIGVLLVGAKPKNCCNPAATRAAHSMKRGNALSVG